MNTRSARMPLAVVISLLLAASACATPSAAEGAAHDDSDDDARIGASPQPLVDGTVDTAHPEALVLRKANGLCSGALIAPNLYLTARHCTAVWTTQSLPCAAGASSEGAASLPVYSGEIDAKEFSVGATQTSEALAGVVRIYTDGAPTSCSHDLVVVELDRKLSIPPARVRRTPVAVGDRLSLVGWGYIDRAAKVVPTQRMIGQTTVLGIGPVVQRYRPFGNGQEAGVAVAIGEIAVAALSTAGDSGGPAYDANGEIAAIVARGFGPDPAQGPASYTTTAGHLDIIDRAFAATSNPPATPDQPAPPTPATGKQAGPGTADDGDNDNDKAAPSAKLSKATPVAAAGCSIGVPPGPLSGRGPSTTALALACAAALLVAARSRRTAMR